MNEFNQLTFNISLVLAHTLLLEYKGQEPFGESWALGGGDPAAPSASESTGQQMQALIQYLPSFLKTVSGQIQPTEQALINSSKAISPQKEQLSTDLYRQFGPQVNKIGSDIAAQNALSQSSSDAAVANSGSAKSLVQGTSDLSRLIDPEFYKNREATSAKYLDLIGGMDPNRLSGAEAANAERGLNRLNESSGNANTPNNPTAAIANAGVFGQALNAKRSLLSQALAGFAPIQSGSRSGIDTFQMTTGKPSMPAFGQGNLGGAVPVGQWAQQAGMGFLDQTGQNQRAGMDINSQRRDSLDRATGVVGALPNV